VFWVLLVLLFLLVETEVGSCWDGRRRDMVGIGHGGWHTGASSASVNMADENVLAVRSRERDSPIRECDRKHTDFLTSEDLHGPYTPQHEPFLFLKFSKRAP
jgi:hypothetical protein